MTIAKIALVTGAGSGIGREVAVTLAENGYRVIAAGRREDALLETAAAARALGRIEAVATDVSDAAAVEALFETVRARHGRLDLLFNNAGSGAPSVPIDELSVAAWQAVVGVNLTGAFLCARQAFKLMKSQDPRGGRIINNGSISSMAPRPNSAPYTATKHAITGLTKSCSLDGRPFDIACGQIDIGNAATDMTARMRQGVPQADGRLAVEPTIDPVHVARAVLYMADLPLDANVQSMTVMATKMPFIGRG